MGKGEREGGQIERKRNGGGERLPHCTLADAISPLSIRDSPCVSCRITRYYPFDVAFFRGSTNLTARAYTSVSDSFTLRYLT